MVAVIFAALLLAGCGDSPSPPTDSSEGAAPSDASSTPAGNAATASAPHYTSIQWGFRINTPEGWTLSHGFPGHYLANDAWKTYAAPDSHGEAVIALVMPGSNKVSDAEIRIGASRDARAVQTCTTPPQSVRADSVKSASINGIHFTGFEAADAAMSHHLQVHAYRVVHQGACYAIDLLVFGTNPQVYDPPATPPFTDAHAFASMQSVFDSFRFTR